MSELWILSQPSTHGQAAYEMADVLLGQVFEEIQKLPQGQRDAIAARIPA